MNKTYTKSEREYVSLVKMLPCSVCDAPGPSAAHHIDQSCAWTVVALCSSCHQDPHNGWHGRKAMWRIKKMVEIDALGITVRRVVESLRGSR